MNLMEELRASLLKNGKDNAFCINRDFYSYETLSQKIFAIVREIKLTGKSNANIGVVAYNDLETYASLMACWFSSCAYVPLNPSIPADRNKFIIKEAQIEIILSSTTQNLEFINMNSNLKIINTSDVFYEAHDEILPLNIDDTTTAYILFTSGSTGRPKGVPITHGNLFAFIKNFETSGFIIDPSDKCLQMFELTFDVSISSFLPPLLAGACVYTVPDIGIKYVQVFKLIQEYQLTSIQIVPSILKLGRKFLDRLKFPWLKACILTGEATFVDLIPIWRECVSNAKIYNFYGPTESTIYCSFYECGETIKHNNGMLAIGKPLGDMKLFIADKDGCELPVYEKGELLIGGAQLASGYLKDPIKSQQSFVELKSFQSMFYRSGDMCYKDEEGDIYYCGRYDNQVKIQGFRVELGEIEYAVREKFGINNVVVVSENGQQLPELILVLELTHSNTYDSINEYLKSKLPVYMLPARISNLMEFPLTTSGKTDRKAIKTILSGELKRNS